MKKPIFLTVLALLAAGVLFAKDNLAILPFSGGQRDEGEAIAELFSFDQRLTEVFTPIPRTSITRAMGREQGFQMRSGMTDVDTIAAIGNQLGAQYVMAGNITAIGRNKLLVISIMKMDTLQQIAGDFQVYTKIEDIRSKVPQMAENIIRATRNNTGALDKLAVVPVQLQGGANEHVADTLAQILAIHLLRSGKYTVYPRTKNLEQVQDEYDNQYSGITADDNIVGLGQGENPHLVLSVVARTLGSVNMFNASIIDLVNGTQATGNSVEYSGIDDGMRAMESLALNLSGPEGDLNNFLRREAEQKGKNPEQRRSASDRNSPEGRAISAGFLNLALGIGSFSMGDRKGGLILVAGYALAGGLMAYELIGLAYEDDLAGVLGPAGVGVVGITALYGFIRPFVYQKSSQTALGSVLDRTHIAIIPNAAGIMTASLSYIYRY
jgi:hypothetical protein